MHYYYSQYLIILTLFPPFPFLWPSGLQDTTVSALLQTGSVCLITWPSLLFMLKRTTTWTGERVLHSALLYKQQFTPVILTVEELNCCHCRWNILQKLFHLSYRWVWVCLFFPGFWLWIGTSITDKVSSTALRRTQGESISPLMDNIIYYLDLYISEENVSVLFPFYFICKFKLFTFSVNLFYHPPDENNFINLLNNLHNLRNGLFQLAQYFPK